MGTQVFQNCTSLTDVTITGNMPILSYGTFDGCTNLTNATLPDSMTEIGMDAFSGCAKLTGVVLPASLQTIGQYVFDGCSSLGNVTIPANVTTIGNYAFRNCTGLTDLTILGDVTSMGTQVFQNCTSLTDVTITGNMPILNYGTFDGCANLTNVRLPDSMTEIGMDAFSGCAKLTGVVLPASLQTIGSYAFDGCSSLASVTIPDSVTSIGDGAFRSCNALATVNYGGTEAQWNAISVGTYNDPLTNAAIQYTPSTRSMVSYAAPGYTDVPADAWYAEAAAYCREHGLMNGTAAATFSPDDTLTRAMMVTVLHRLAGTPAAAAASSFSDVEPGKWCAEAVSWASGKGIVQGYGDGTFRPNDPVTHGQVALIFQRYSGNPNVQTVGADTPRTPATRAEIAVTLMNYAKGQELAPGTLSVFSAMDVMCSPSGIAQDRDGSLLITDLYNKQIWRVLNRASESYAGGATMEDLYGQPVGGYNDAGLGGSYFKEPWAIAPFLGGWAVSDAENNVVRLIQANGVQTLNGAANEKLTVTKLGVAFNHPTGLASDSEGNLYVSDTFNGAVRKITPKGGVSTAAENLADPTGLCWKDGVLYIAETGANRIVKLQNGKVVRVAGSGQEGLSDGAAERSTFSAPQGVAAGDDGSVYVADTGSSAVRKIKDGAVTTLAARDPERLDGGLASPAGLLVQDGRLYICDTFARKVFVYQLA